MGSKHFKCSNEYASISLSLPKLGFGAGETVTGQIHLHVQKPYQAAFLDVSIKGKQKTHWSEQHGRHRVHYHGKREIIRQSIPIVTYNNTIIQPGFYNLPFAFVLPVHLPSSLVWFQGEGDCSITYKVKAIIKASKKEQSLQMKNLLYIYNRIYPQPMTDTVSHQTEVRSYCCAKKGKSKIACKFEKNAYYYDQTARVLLNLNNRNCTVDLSRIQIQLIQSTVIFNNSHRKFRKNVIVATQKYPGISKHSASGETEQRFCELDLRLFAHRRLSKSAGYMKALKKHYGDRFLQSTTHSSLIQMSYYIKVKTEYDVLCMAYSMAPKVLLQIQLAGKEEPYPGVQAQVALANQPAGPPLIQHAQVLDLPGQPIAQAYPGYAPPVQDNPLPQPENAVETTGGAIEYQVEGHEGQRLLEDNDSDDDLKKEKETAKYG